MCFDNYEDPPLNSPSDITERPTPDISKYLSPNTLQVNGKEVDCDTFKKYFEQKRNIN